MGTAALLQGNLNGHALGGEKAQPEVFLRYRRRRPARFSDAGSFSAVSV